MEDLYHHLFYGLLIIFILYPLLCLIAMKQLIKVEFLLLEY